VWWEWSPTTIRVGSLERKSTTVRARSLEWITATMICSSQISIHPVMSFSGGHFLALIVPVLAAQIRKLSRIESAFANGWRWT